MKLLESFTLQHIDDVLRNTFSFSVENKLYYSMNKFNGNDSVHYLEVKGEGILQQYVLVKVSKGYNAKSNINPSVLQPVFVIHDNRSESFGAFDKEHLNKFISPEENNLDHLKTILKTLAQFQARNLIISDDNETLSEYRVKDITDNILSLDYFNCEENTKFTETLEKLQVMLNGLLKSNLLVLSVWSSLASNAYVKKDSSSSVFLQVTSKQLLMPPSYDALLYIFSLSDQKFRQNHFQDLRLYYFKSLTEALQLHNNTVERVSRKYAEPEIETLLPIIKFTLANDLAKTKSSPRFEEILVNILNYLKYPMINQEDIYEAIKNTLLSDDYDLLSYQLVPLGEKNGHLGEYFHLKISIKFQTKEIYLNHFAKFLLVNSELMSDIIDRGVGKKEDFFYSILYPLYLEHGLEDLLDFAPKCYVSRLRFLVLEDFGRLGYEGLKPNAILNYQSLKTILAKVAKFHACTLIVEEILSRQSGKKIRLGDRYAEYFKETVLVYEDQSKDWFDGNLKSLHYIYDKCPDISEKLSLSNEQLKEKLKEFLFSPFETVKISDTIRNVVNHGDMYVANMLFKSRQDKIIDDGILIDFQLLRYIPPAFEVLFFILVNSTKETRDKYWQFLLNWYYENLSAHLKTFNLDPEEIISREQFNEDVSNSKSAALAHAFNYSHIIHVDPDFREDIFHDADKMKYYLVDNKEEFIDISLKQEHYKILVKGLIEDIIDFIKTSVEKIELK